MAQEERPVDSAAKAICCGPARQFAAFQGDIPNWPRRAGPGLQQATIMEPPATAAHPPRNEVARASMFQAKDDSR
jgi:hypothetical protein